MDWGKLCQEAGIAMTLVVAGIVILLLLIKWVLEQFKTELTLNRQERADYLVALNKIGSSVDEHNQRSREFMTNVNAQHNEMITTLARINGYKHE